MVPPGPIYEPQWSPGKRVHELSTNIRSGEDLWWNEVLEQCRKGELSDDNYNWIHGYPTSVSICRAPLKYWYAYRKEAKGNNPPPPQCESLAQIPGEEEMRRPCTNPLCKDEQGPCFEEKERRRLLLKETEKIPAEFQEAILITPHTIKPSLCMAKDVQEISPCGTMCS